MSRKLQMMATLKGRFQNYQSQLNQLLMRLYEYIMKLQVRICHRLAANEQGFMQGCNFITSSPEPLPNKINKVEVNNKKYSNERPAETKTQQR
jgi:N-acetylglutamate synthase-like GNAT family acetyltransferase